MHKDFSVTEVIEPETGRVHRLYKYKGKVCKRVTLDTPMARQLAGYSLIEKDLRSSLIWLKEIDSIRGNDIMLDKNYHAKDRVKYNLVKGLFVAALTFYGKVFAQCEGRRIKLDRKNIDSEFRDAHDQAILLRNNFAAHSGAELIERAEIALIIPPRSKKSTVIMPNIYRELNQPDYGSPSKGEKSMLELVNHVRSITLEKINQLSEKILSEDVIPKGYEYWYSK